MDGNAVGLTEKKLNQMKRLAALGSLVPIILPIRAIHAVEPINNLPTNVFDVSLHPRTCALYGTCDDPSP